MKRSNIFVAIIDSIPLRSNRAGGLFEKHCLLRTAILYVSFIYRKSQTFGDHYAKYTSNASLHNRVRNGALF